VLAALRIDDTRSHCKARSAESEHIRSLQLMARRLALLTIIRAHNRRHDERRALGPSVTTPMGGANGIGFQPTGGGKAAITGDFLVTGDEVNPLIRELRRNGIEVTAIHSHMLTEQPRMFFIHFWANDDAVKLAKGLRAALDKTAIAKN
jgi:Domain of Unknown Function (DUF1259)